jgi:hypothetical protein
MEARGSNISSLSYDGTTKELTVIFNSGTRWRYFGVDDDVADGLRTAESQGAYLKRHVIDVCQSKKLDERHERL